MSKKRDSFIRKNSSIPHTILGEETHFKGSLNFEGQVRIEGKLEGDIQTQDICVVGKSGFIHGNIIVGQVIIHGTIHGKISATTTVELHPSAKMYGEVRCQNLIVHHGAILQGKITMENSSSEGKFSEEEVDVKNTIFSEMVKESSGIPHARA